MKNTKLVWLALIVILFGIAFYRFNLSSTPPQLSLSSGRYQGFLSRDLCKLPGHEFSEEDVREFDAPGGVPEFDLEDGIHLYHADEDLTMGDVINLIEPDEDNEVIIAYYSNADEGFYVYPPGMIDDEFEVVDPEDFEIPANHGFVIMSCRDAKIWKIKGEGMFGGSLAAGLENIDAGWILLSRPEEVDLSSLTERLNALWVQDGQGFSFSKISNPSEPDFDDDYYMMWLKLDAALDHQVELEFENQLRDILLEIDAAIIDYEATFEAGDSEDIEEAFEDLLDALEESIAEAEEGFEELDGGEEELEEAAEALEDFREEISTLIQIFEEEYAAYIAGLEDPEDVDVVDFNLDEDDNLMNSIRTRVNEMDADKSKHLKDLSIVTSYYVDSCDECTDKSRTCTGPVYDASNRMVYLCIKNDAIDDTDFYPASCNDCRQAVGVPADCRDCDRDGYYAKCGPLCTSPPRGKDCDDRNPNLTLDCP